MQPATKKRRRGRPPRSRDSLVDTQELLIQAGVAALTEKGFSATGLEEILGMAGVPKGSFYHYFASKEAFGSKLIERYGSYFNRKLNRHFSNEQLTPLARFDAFIADAESGMARFGFRRGCLVGNLGQELSALPESYREELREVFRQWEASVASCLREAQTAGEISGNLDCDRLAACFWIGWEGAVLRAKLERSAEPLRAFARFFKAGLHRS